MKLVIKTSRYGRLVKQLLRNDPPFLWRPKNALKNSRARRISSCFPVKVLDGRSGHPLKNVVIDIWFGERVSGVPRQSRTGRDGTTLVTVPEGERTFVAAGEFIADCRSGNVAGKSFIDRNVYSVDGVLMAGIVGENQCGRADPTTPFQ